MSRDLFSTRQLMDFWPSEERSYIDNINATIRFIMYSSVLIFILSGDPRVVYLGIIVTSFLLYSADRKGAFEDYEEEPVVVPSFADVQTPQPYPEAPVNPPTAPNPCIPGDRRCLAASLSTSVQNNFQDRQFTPQVRGTWDPSAQLAQLGTGFRGTNQPTTIIRGQGLPFEYPGTQNTILG